MATAAHDPTAIVDRALQVARELCGLELAYVAEFREGEQVVRRTDHAPGSEVNLHVDSRAPLEASFCQRMADGRLPSVIPDTRAYAGTAEMPIRAGANLGAYVGVPLRLPDGRLYGSFCAVASDARPELGERHAELLRVLARLVAEQLEQHEHESAARKAQNDLLGSVSHDLRTPLKAVQFLAEDLAAQAPGMDPARAGELITREVDRVLAMVDDLLLVARQRAGELTLERTLVDVGELARHAASTCALAAGQDGERLVCELPVEPIEAELDAPKVLQALQNLIDNGVKYSPRGGPVTVTVTRDAQTALLEVADEGIGVGPDELARLGERFFRAGTAVAEGIPGIGLGLATARAVADAHGGVLGATSEQGRGTTFRLRLPLRPAP